MRAHKRIIINRLNKNEEKTFANSTLETETSSITPTVIIEPPEAFQNVGDTRDGSKVDFVDFFQRFHDQISIRYKPVSGRTHEIPIKRTLLPELKALAHTYAVKQPINRIIKSSSQTQPLLEHTSPYYFKRIFKSRNQETSKSRLNTGYTNATHRDHAEALGSQENIRSSRSLNFHNKVYTKRQGISLINNINRVQQVGQIRQQNAQQLQPRKRIAGAELNSHYALLQQQKQQNRLKAIREQLHNIYNNSRRANLDYYENRPYNGSRLLLRSKVNQ